MPKETIYHPEIGEGDTNDPRRIDITWGNAQPGVEINGIPVDRSALNRLIRITRRARDTTYGRDE